MHHRWRWLGVALLALLVLAAVTTRVFTTARPLATLGTRVIEEADFEQYLVSCYSPEAIDKVKRSAAERNEALEGYLDSLAVAAKARRVGIDQEMRFKKAVELMEMKLLSRLMTERFRDSIIRNSQVSDEEVKAYYELHKQELTVKPRFTAHHLLVYVKGNPAFPEKGLTDAAAQVKAQQALAKLRAGVSWDVVTSSYSDEVATNQKGGLIRDGQFGYFAKEVEAAVKTQELGRPGKVIKSVFGYHVLEVVERFTEPEPEPFEKAKEVFTERLVQQRSREVRMTFMTPFWQEVGFQVMPAGKRDAPVLNDNAMKESEVLAEVGGKKVLESDFRWFLKDALTAPQRTSAYGRPGARQGMLSSYLDMLVLEAKARKDGLDKTPAFIQSRNVEEKNLLSEFVQEWDQVGPAHQSGLTEEAQQLAHQAYLKQLRTEANLKRVPGRR